MARERISDDYEDFEPEVRIWPYWMLAFLLQAVPVLLSIALGQGSFLSLTLRAFYGIFPLLFTASIMREGERPWRLAIGGALYVLLELVLWIVASLGGAEGFALGVPFGLVLSPVVLSLSAYVFFLKRRRGKWIGTVLVSYMLEAVFLFMITRYSEGGIFFIYPMLLVVLTTFNLFVTRRTDGTPWFIALVLGLLIIASAAFEPAVSALFSSPSSGNDVATALLGVFAFGQHFWYTLSFLFVFSGLASKSSYRRVYEPEDAPEESVSAGYYDDTQNEEPVASSFAQREEPVVNYSFRDERQDSRYSYPPEYSRREEQEPVRAEETCEARRPEEPRVETPRSPRYEDEYRKPSSNNDKWYEFISGGVSDDSNSRRPSSSYAERDRRDDRYQEERDRRYYDDRRDRDYRRDDRRDRTYDDRDREAYRRNLYDDRDPYYSDRRRDDRYCDDRRDDRYYGERSRRDYGDRRDYDDRRDDPRSSRRYEDDYEPRARRYEDDRERP